MFKKLIISIQKNMSTSNKNPKQTLAKKLKAKQLEAEAKTENGDLKAAPSKRNAAHNEAEGRNVDTSKPRRVKSVGQKMDHCAIEMKKVKRNNLGDTSDVLKTTKKNNIKVEPSTSTGVSKTEQELVDLAQIKYKKDNDPADVTTDHKFSAEVKEEPANDKWEPNNWITVLENIREMRSKDNAPVDTMGCHKCADENADEKTQRFHKLVALMLSSQTKDETTYHAMLRLREHTLTPEAVSEMKPNVLEQILHPVSFYKNKAKYLQQTSRILIDKYNSDIPNNIKELVSLPGVGPKMAHICMATAWHETTGIGVDVHVHRICNRLRWVPKPTKEPEQTRAALESWLPRDMWQEVNHLLVGFGQTTCTPLKPKCSDCLNCDICPAAPKTKKTQEKRENKEVINICEKAKFKKAKMHV